MTTALWTLRALIVLAIATALHWSLPSRDIVRILGTEVVRMRTGGDGADAPATRDVRHINAVTPEGDVRVYRNEDTGWGWPPYLKFDSANLAAKAANAASTEDNPRWMIVTHYGWRVTLMSWFPNAIEITPAKGPDQRLIPWFNIVVVTLLAALLLLVRHRIRRLLGF